MRRLFKQFSFPGGIPSHAAPETPGSIHEGGELGYSLSPRVSARCSTILICWLPAWWATAKRKPGRWRRRWHSNKFLNPATRRRGAADPASERLQDRQSDGAGAHDATRSWSSLFAAMATTPYFVEGRRSGGDASADGRDPRRGDRGDPRHPGEARGRSGMPERPRWPMIVLRSPKGWTGPKMVDGKPVEGTCRAHQVPLADPATSRST